MFLHSRRKRGDLESGAKIQPSLETRWGLKVPRVLAFEEHIHAVLVFA